jgi:predicted PurR-regulated permease PerM
MSWRSRWVRSGSRPACPGSRRHRVRAAACGDIVVTLFIAITFAEALRPLVDWLQRRCLPRAVAVLLQCHVIAAILTFLAYLLVSPLVAQVGQLQRSLPSYMTAAQQFLARVQRLLGTNPRTQQALQQLQ